MSDELISRAHKNVKKVRDTCLKNNFKELGNKRLVMRFANSAL